MAIAAWHVKAHIKEKPNLCINGPLWRNLWIPHKRANNVESIPYNGIIMELGYKD